MSEHSVKKDVPLWCRLLGHRWEQTLVGDRWRFRCQRCARVEGYCGMRDLPPGEVTR